MMEDVFINKESTFHHHSIFLVRYSAVRCFRETGPAGITGLSVLAVKPTGFQPVGV